jgi:anti-sigma B factor antagonist
MHAIAMAGENYKLRWVGQHAVIPLPAEIDATNAEGIRQALVSAASHDAAVLVIDMSETTFCDSAGVNAIIAAHKQAKAAGTQLRLVAPGVLRILTLVGADQLVPIYPTLETALAETAAAQARAPNPGHAPERAAATGDPQTEPPPAEPSAAGQPPDASSSGPPAPAGTSRHATPQEPATAGPHPR